MDLNATKPPIFPQERPAVGSLYAGGFVFSLFGFDQAVEEDHFTFAEPSPKSWSMLAISSGDGLIRYWSLNARSRCSRS